MNQLQCEAVTNPRVPFRVAMKPTVQPVPVPLRTICWPPATYSDVPETNESGARCRDLGVGGCDLNARIPGRIDLDSRILTASERINDTRSAEASTPIVTRLARSSRSTITTPSTKPSKLDVAVFRAAASSEKAYSARSTLNPRTSLPAPGLYPGFCRSNSLAKRRLSMSSRASRTRTTSTPPSS